MSDDKKIIFSMSGLTKSYQSSNTPVLKNIYLSFFYGAKIGILGLNGSGKSTLLKIIAGVDKNYQGDVVFSQDYSVGYLEQEPKLDESKTVMEIVREGAAETVAILDEYNKINDMFGLEEVYSDADKMEKLMAQQAELQDKIDAVKDIITEAYGDSDDQETLRSIAEALDIALTRTIEWSATIEVSGTMELDLLEDSDTDVEQEIYDNLSVDTNHGNIEVIDQEVTNVREN